MYNRSFSFLVAIALIGAMLLTACGGSAGEQVKGRLTVGDGSKSFDYTFDLPADWVGKVKMNNLGHAFSVHYDAEPAALFFTITSMTEEEWQNSPKEPGAGEILLTLEGIHFVLNMGLENPYIGAQGDEFQAMAAQVRDVAASMSIKPVR